MIKRLIQARRRMTRIIPHSVVLGVGDDVFHLLKGEEIEVLETDKYNQVLVQMQGKEVLINGVMLDRISNI